MFALKQRIAKLVVEVIIIPVELVKLARQWRIVQHVVAMAKNVPLVLQVLI
jgi:hypothetical protein